MEGPTKRRHRQRLYGHITSAVGERRYLVHFDDGTEKECPSAVLRVEKVVANLPPDIQVPAPSNTAEAAEVQEAEDEIVDQDEEEALPEAPEGEEAEVTAELEGEEAAEEAAKAADESQPSGMIGQLPTEQKAALASGKDYATIKKLAWGKVKSLLGNEVVVKTKKNGSMTWKVIDSIDPDLAEAIPEVHGNFEYGLKGFSCGNYKKSEIISSIFLCLLLELQSLPRGDRIYSM